MPDVKIVTLSNVGAMGVSKHGVYHADEQFVEWLDETADLSEYEGALLFKVNRKGDRVVAAFVNDDPTHPADGYQIEIGHHEPFKAVILAGMAVSTILAVFEPMNYADQLGFMAA